MAGQGKPLDTGKFYQTSALFEQKRKALAPDVVRHLARDIVLRVSNMRHAVRPGPDAPVAVARIATFCDLLMQPSPDRALDFVRGLQAEGVSHEAILHAYLAEAARMLGTRWEADQASFLQVTVGASHIFALMRAIAPVPGAKRAEGGHGRNALFAVVPGETHTLGARMAAETFRDAGWSIDLQVGMDHDALLAHIEEMRPGVIGLSMSTEQRLADLVRLVVALRLVCPVSIIGVAPPLELTDEAVRQVVDVDVIFRDARVAVRDLMWLLQMKA